jgi:HK97 family phage portal protein
MTTRTLATRVGDALRAYWQGPVASRDPAAATLFGATPTTTGVVVSEWTALNFSAVWAAVNCISSAVATLPLHHYRRLANGGKERYFDSKLYPILRWAFNPRMSSSVARRMMQGHVLTWGNAYAEIVWNQAGQIAGLYPIEPDRVTPVVSDTGALFYRVTGSAGQMVDVPDWQIFHLKGLSYDGLEGYSPIRLARESIGSGLGMQLFQNTFYGQGTSFGGFFLHPKQLGEKAKLHLEQSLRARHEGKPHRFSILEEGMTFKEGTMPLKDAEFLNSRKFAVTDIARWFNIPPHKLGDLEHRRAKHRLRGIDAPALARRLGGRDPAQAHSGARAAPAVRRAPGRRAPPGEHDRALSGVCHRPAARLSLDRRHPRLREFEPPAGRGRTGVLHPGRHGAGRPHRRHDRREDCPDAPADGPTAHAGSLA